MTPWSPQPSHALATDLRLLTARPEVQALVFRLGHVSRGGRVLYTDSAVAAVRAACGGAEWAIGALDDAVEAGFLTVETGAIVLGWEWPSLASERSTSAPVETPIAPSQAAALVGLSADALRRARWKFERRIDRWSAVPSGVTWESVLEPASPWHRLLKSDGRQHRDAPGRSGTRPATPTGTDTGTVAGRPATTLPPSDSPLPEKKEESQHRDAQAPAGERDGNGTDTGTVAGRTGTPTGTRPQRESDPLTVLAEASKGGVSGIAAAHVRMELITFATANNLALADFEAAGRLLSTPEGRRKAWPWLDATGLSRAASVQLLRGRGGAWTTLTAAIEAARIASTQKRPSQPPAAPQRPKRAPIKPLTEEQKRALLEDRPMPSTETAR